VLGAGWKMLGVGRICQNPISQLIAKICGLSSISA